MERLDALRNLHTKLADVPDLRVRFRRTNCPFLVLKRLRKSAELNVVVVGWIVFCLFIGKVNLVVRVGVSTEIL